MPKTVINWRNLKRELVVPSKNSYVYKLGFRYAIYWYSDITEAEKAISNLLGSPNYEWHYTKQSGIMKLKTGIVPYPERRWFWGGQRWGDKYKHQPHWAVFKTEKDRTLALLTL